MSHDTKRIVFKPEKEYKGYEIDIPTHYVDYMVVYGHEISEYVFFYQIPIYEPVRLKRGYKDIMYSHNAMAIFISREGSFIWKRLKKTNHDKTCSNIIYNGIIRTDTFEYSGKSQHLYWRNITILTKKTAPIRRYDDIECIEIGYENVPIQYKALFDSCLFTLRPLQDTTIKVDDISRKIDSLQQIQDGNMNNYD
jgi:hypothetical protein